MQLQFPKAFAVVVHKTVPVGCSVTVTGVLGVPVPLNVGVVSLTAAPAVGAVTDGDVLSTVKLRVVAGLVLPAASVAVMPSAWGPFGNAVLSQDQAPDGDAAIAVQSTLPFSSLTVIVLPGSATPLTVGVLSPLVELGAGAVTTGATGATVSTVTGTSAPAGLVLPAGSVATACS